MKKSKSIVFAILLLGMSVPMIQHFTHFANEKGLRGSVINSTYQNISDSTWFNGHFQTNTDKYLNDNFGFRPDFVRINNQLDFSLYQKANANGVVIGKEWYMYEYNYIKAYYGLDFIGDAAIAEKTRKLKFIQDTLQKQGKQLLVVFAVGKGSYLPEYFPDSINYKVQRSNYKAYLEAFNDQQINHVDFQKWFLEKKDTTKYPIYGKGGIHWSKYAESLVADSMLRLMKTMTESKFPDLIIEGYDVESKNKNGDYDIGEGINILFQAETFPMAYPKLRIENTQNNQTKTTFVADSYFWGMYRYGWVNSLFNNGQFWFYNNEIYTNDLIADNHVSNVDIQQEIEKNDFIVLLSTDANLHKFAFGFIEQLYDSYNK